MGRFISMHQFVGQEEFLMGNVDEGVTREDIRDEFKGCNVYTKEKCRNCFASFTAAAAVRPTHITFIIRSMMLMISAVS